MFNLFISFKKIQKKKKKPGYGWWLFRKKGTASEPWPTAKDLWEDPEAQKMFQEHNYSVVSKIKEAQKKRFGVS